MSVLRQALRNDVADLTRIRAAVTENRLTSRTISQAELVQALEQDGRGWVVESQGKIVAFSIADARTGSIWALFVDPPHEGLGYGRRLHDAAVSYLWTCGFDRLWLTTEPDTRAQRFYEKAGWACVGEVPGGELRFELLRPSGSAHARAG